MSITLVQVEPADSAKEFSFGQAVVRVGREAGDSDVVFEGTRFPMVSRRHAEFRLEGGKWWAVDLESSYGVFVNGERVAGRAAISAGSRIQFGTDGPALLVIWADEKAAGQAPQAKPVAEAVPAQRIATPAEPSRPEPSASPAESWEMGAPAAVTPPPAEIRIPEASLEFVDDPAAQPFAIGKASIWIGRDHSCDVVIADNAAMVSRRHAVLRFEAGNFVLEDNNSFNGTLVNEQRIAAATPLYDQDTIRLGKGGPVIKFRAAARPAPKGASLAGQRAVAHSLSISGVAAPAEPGSKTMVVDREAAEKFIPKTSADRPQLVMSVTFDDRGQLVLGRDPGCDIRLDGLQISKRHARFIRTAAGVAVEDLRSTNGVFVNGSRVTKHLVGPQDSIQIGVFLIGVDAAGQVNVFDTRARTRVDAVDVVRQVKDRSSGAQIALLDSVSLSIQPNEFVGLLGPSGAGKSMLIEVMNGSRPPTSGRVMINDLDLYRNIDSLKNSIGYVPQEDIIHRDLTVFRTLYYVARLRLSRDVSSSEIRDVVNEVLDVTGLTERRDVRVSSLSGGQRKRVSIAVELITKPSVIFLDEPTSGLDPAAEERVMKLFRQIAESGRTVILTTHAMENVALFDKIAVLMGGKLVFYGTPDEALKYMKVSSFKELYSKLEEPVTEGIKEHGEANRRQITENAASQWSTKFRSTPQFEKYVRKPLAELAAGQGAGIQKKRRLGLIGSFAQWLTLSRRYFEVLFNDKLTLFILLAQAPIIAIMTFIVVGADKPRDFLYFVLAIVAVWFGTSVSAREIIRENSVYRRERMVNLGLIPYLFSKLFVIGIIVLIQCFLLFVPLKLLDLAGLLAMPGELLGIPQFWAMLLTAAVGIGLGLLVSALVRTSEMATGLVPLILIPQLLFSGLVGVPNGVGRVISLTMPAAWSFDTIKRFSTLDTLEPEGANPKGKTRGMGLYDFIESENEKVIAKAKKDFEDYKRLNESRYQNEDPAQIDTSEVQSMTIKKVPDDLSGYVTFLHPWMNEVLNQFVLVLMFGMLVLATLVILRLKDIF